MTVEELLPWLFSRATGGMRWGLQRTEALCAGVDNPHRRFHSLLIGGTNGKGSVAALAESVLRTHLREPVGLYTSPHLVHFAERIRIGGAPVEAELLRRVALRLRPRIEQTGASFFEATTAIAFSCFAEAGVRAAVVEVGLGGRLDATNVLHPAAVAITNVARDHAEILGNTVAEIAREKAGILKRGVPAAVGLTPGDALDVVRQHAASVGAELRVLDEVAEIRALRSGADGTHFRLHLADGEVQPLSVPLAGAHQARNAALAAVALRILPEPLRPDWEAIRGGFAAVWWPGRLQVERIGSTTWVFDVAHNPAGVEALVEAVPRLAVPRPLVVLGGVLADKEWGTMIPRLLSIADAAILTTAPSVPPGRRWDLREVARTLVSPAASVRYMPHFEEALNRAATLAPHGTVLVTGSFHTVGDAMLHLGISTV